MHAPFAARLLALTLTIQALFGLLSAWMHRRLLATLQDPDPDYDSHDRVFAQFSALADGGTLLGLLLAGLIVVGAVRYGNNVGDARVRLLSLGSAALLALDAARGAAFKLADWLRWDPEVVVRWWGPTGLLLGGGGIVLLVIAAARGERLRTGSRPRWPFAVAGVFALYLLVTGLAGAAPREDLGFALVDLLAPLHAAAELTLAVGLLIHARRLDHLDHLDHGDPQAGWVRAADGLDRYRDATALRLLTLVGLVVFLMLARVGRWSPTVTLGGLCLIALVGLIIGLVQIAGLVRVADAPGPRITLGVALPLIGLATATECVSLAPLFNVMLRGEEGMAAMRHLDLGMLGATAQGLAMIAVITLLLALRGLAREREAPHLVARCERLIATIVIVAVVVAAAAYVVPQLKLGRDAAAIVLLGAGLTLLSVAATVLVLYLRLLAALRDAMGAPR
jgi:hypothetical protein